MWLPRFACPECRTTLVETVGGRVRLRACGASFERRDGVWRFLTRRGRTRARRRSSAQYRHVRERDGHVARGRPTTTATLPIGRAGRSARRRMAGRAARPITICCSTCWPAAAAADARARPRRRQRLAVASARRARPPRGRRRSRSTTRSTGSARARHYPMPFPWCRRISTRCRSGRSSSTWSSSTARCTTRRRGGHARTRAAGMLAPAARWW